MPTSLEDILAEKQRELARLQLMQQHYGQPKRVNRRGIAVMFAGTVCSSVGLVVNIYLLMAGAALMVTGGIMLIAAMHRHYAALKDIEQINRRIEVLQQQVTNIESFFVFVNNAPAVLEAKKMADNI